MPGLSFKTPEVQHFDEKFLEMFHFIQLILILNPAEGIQPWVGHHVDLVDHAHYRLGALATEVASVPSLSHHTLENSVLQLSEGLGVITALRQSLISELF